MSSYNYSPYCNNKLLSTFPELLEDNKYKEIIEDALSDSDHSAHGIYEDAFCPYVLDLIKKNDQDSRQKVKKAFVLLEEIASHEDYYIRNVAEVSFIEKFTADTKPMKDVEKYLLPNSLELAREVAQERYGRNPRTWEERSRTYRRK